MKRKLRRVKGATRDYYWEHVDEIVTYARKDGRVKVMQRYSRPLAEIRSFEKNPDKVTLAKFADKEGRRGEMFLYKSSNREIARPFSPQIYIGLSEGLISGNPSEIVRLLFNLANKLNSKSKIKRLKRTLGW